jgi:hypothetical protein
LNRFRLGFIFNSRLGSRPENLTGSFLGFGYTFNNDIGAVGYLDIDTHPVRVARLAPSLGFLKSHTHTDNAVMYFLEAGNPPVDNVIQQGCDFHTF